MRPGATHEVTIGRLGALGDGIADTAGGPVYVPGALPGERVRAVLKGRRGEGWAADLAAVVEPASGRVAPPCPHFGACGGCALQHIDAAACADWKRGLVETALRRRGFAEVEVAPVVTTPPASRRRAQFAARRRGRRVALGFNEAGGRRIVDLRTCHVLRPALVGLLPPLRDFLPSVLPDGAAADVQVTETDTGLDLWILHDAPLTLARREALAAFAAAQDLARLTWGGRAPETVVLRRPPLVTIAGVAVEPPPGAFLQPSREGEAALTGLVRQGVGEAARVADLFAGCGTFALVLADRAAVHAVDGAADLIAALDAAARRVGGLRSVTTEARDLFRRPLQPAELDGYEAVVFDPPRAGASAQAATLAASKAPRVMAVSCNPATFARDARMLVDGGYRLERVTPVDQFLWSPHVELAAAFGR